MATEPACPQRTECTPHGCSAEDCPYKGEHIYRMALKLVGEYNAGKEKIAARGYRRIGEHFRTDEITLAEQVVQLHNELLVARGDSARPEALCSGGVGLSAHEADVIAAAVQLAPLLEEGWDDQDTPEDQNEGSKACDALVAAVNAMLSVPSPLVAKH